MSVRIEGITPGSPAEAAGLRAGMELVSLDSHPIRDGLDYEFYSPGTTLCAIVQTPGGASCEFHIQKEEYEPLGCEFSSYLIDEQHTCRNKCVFCFIDQLPKGLRPSLYFKDDDERLSFLFGNYVTLTNLGDAEVDRIIEMRIAPVNISVHTANPVLRVQMMHNKNAGEVLRFIPKIAGAGIPINCQLVLCPGLNDGEELRRSIEWLAGFAPAMQSIAAVPVGLSRHREGLYPLTPYTRETAAEQLAILLEYGERYLRELGTRLVYPSDEWFLLAGRPIPEDAFYEDYAQLENGVGMWRLLLEEFTAALADTEFPASAVEADILVGESAGPLFHELASLLEKAAPHARLHVHTVKNDFFGHGITVSGLLTGKDIIAQLSGKLRSGTLLLPSLLLRSEGDLLLDDTTPEDISKALGVEVRVSGFGGDDLLNAILENTIV